MHHNAAKRILTAAVHVQTFARAAQGCQMEARSRDACDSQRVAAQADLGYCCTAARSVWTSQNIAGMQVLHASGVLSVLEADMGFLLPEATQGQTQEEQGL
jgi:hypothetical protein